MKEASESSASARPPSQQTRQWTREHALVVVLVVGTAALVALCFLLLAPFLSSLTWAVALAVMAHPLHSWVERHVPNRNVAAALAVGLVFLLIVLPLGFVLHHLALQAAYAAELVRSGTFAAQLEGALQKWPPLAPLQLFLTTQLSGETPVTQGLHGLYSFVTGSIRAAVDLLITFFFLFFLFRDRATVLNFLRSLLPLAASEEDVIFRRLDDTIRATIYGTLVVAVVQGTLGALMFWWLGLPAPLLWGVIMAVLALVPVLGAFVVWIPAASYLLITGAWIKALLLTLWGTVVIGLIDNLLYPALVGDRLRLHTAVIFVAIVGGLVVFGAAGLILGPLIVALTQALLEVWRRRTSHGAAEEAVINSSSA